MRGPGGFTGQVPVYYADTCPGFLPPKQQQILKIITQWDLVDRYNVSWPINNSECQSWLLSGTR